MGKTTLALEVGEQRPSIYLDLESDADRAKLAEPELYLAGHEDKLVILDEVRRVPDLFQNLRGLIDRGRRKGLRSGRFLLLGSASMDLLKSLARAWPVGSLIWNSHRSTASRSKPANSTGFGLEEGSPTAFWRRTTP
ncbi:AAA family ATPase [Rhizobium mongolense]|uniref:AAA family ATPase n=1 Tax=Rhizobium mongolense TaxID=57676 RepID=UPI003556C822